MSPRPSLLRRIGPAAAVLALGTLLAGCADDAPQDTFVAEGEYAEMINRLMAPVWLIAGLVFIVVLGGALIISLRFRAKDEEEFDDIPAQIHGHNALEIGWTVLPALVLAVIGFFSVAAIFTLNEDLPEDAVEIEVIGNQWWWEYRYDVDQDGEFDIVTANDLIIPAGEKVRLNISARDVIHSFWAPKLNGKRDAVPNRWHPWNLQANEPGEFIGQCTEFCGLSHAEMRIKVIALERSDYDAWVEAQQTDAPTYTEDDMSEEAKGYRVFTGQLCASCHLIEGVNDDNFSDEGIGEFNRDIMGGPGTITDPELQASRHAPNLTHLMSRTTFAGAKFNLRRDTDYCTDLGETWANEPEDLERCLDRGALEAWLRNPPAEKAMQPEPVPGRSPIRGMPNLELSEEQIDQLIAYLVTLK